MRTVTIKRIEELDYKEVELLLKNKAVQKEVIQYAIDSEIGLTDMWVGDHFGGTLDNWYIVERDGELKMDMDVKHHRSFILQLEAISNVYDIISGNNEVKKLIKEASVIIKFMERFMEFLKDERDSCVWLTLNDKVHDIANDVKDILVQACRYEINSLRDFSIIESGYDYMYLWIEDNGQRKCMIDGNEIFLFNIEK